MRSCRSCFLMNMYVQYCRSLSCKRAAIQSYLFSDTPLDLCQRYRSSVQYLPYFIGLASSPTLNNSIIELISLYPGHILSNRPRNKLAGYILISLTKIRPSAVRVTSTMHSQKNLCSHVSLASSVCPNQGLRAQRSHYHSVCDPDKSPLHKLSLPEALNLIKIILSATLVVSATRNNDSTKPHRSPALLAFRLSSIRVYYGQERLLCASSPRAPRPSNKNWSSFTRIGLFLKLQGKFKIGYCDIRVPTYVMCPLYRSLLFLRYKTHLILDEL